MPKHLGKPLLLDVEATIIREGDEFTYDHVPVVPSRPPFLRPGDLVFVIPASRIEGVHLVDGSVSTIEVRGVSDS